MLRYLVLVVLVTVGLVAQDVTRLKEVADATAKESAFSGSALVARDGVVLLDVSYGAANAEWEIPNTPDTKFRIGSITKQFTAAALLLLEERGRLKLDDPVSKYVPDSPAAWEPITLFHLLTHTAGIPSFTNHPEYAAWKRSPATVEQTVARFREAPLEFVPGSQHRYSNSGYILLGYVIERVAGQSYAAFLQENLFQPLAMTASGYDSPAILPRRASGYVRSGAGLANAPYIHMQVPHAAGALYSTTHDLLRWHHGLFGGRVLSDTSLQKMITPFQKDYALGVVVKKEDGRTAISHGGSIEGFNAYAVYYPERRLSVIALANVNGPAAEQLARRLAAVALGDAVKLPAERAAAAVPEATLRSYVGVYRLGPNLTNTIRCTDGQLTTQLSGQAQLPLFPESDTRFFLKVVDAQVEFVRDAGGRVTHLVQFQNGRRREAARISDTVVERTAVEITRAAKEACEGTYELRPGFDLRIWLEGEQLMSQATGQTAVAVFPESETRFFLKLVDAQLEFFPDAGGRVTHLVLRQGPTEIKAPRKP